MAERVAAARRLAGAGVPVAAIAAALSVSASSVHNYLSAAPCPGCGGPVTNPNAARCAACTAHEATVARTWTRDAVRTALRAWEAEHGRMPTYREWTPSRTQPGPLGGREPALAERRRCLRAVRRLERRAAGRGRWPAHAALDRRRRTRRPGRLLGPHRPPADRGGPGRARVGRPARPHPAPPLWQPAAGMGRRRAGAAEPVAPALEALSR